LLFVVCSLEREYNIRVNTGNSTLYLGKQDDQCDDDDNDDGNDGD